MILSCFSAQTNKQQQHLNFSAHLRSGTALPVLTFVFFIIRNFLCLLHHPPHSLSFRFLIQHTRNLLLAVKHQKRAELLAVNLLCPVLRFLLLADVYKRQLRTQLNGSLLLLLLLRDLPSTAGSAARSTGLQTSSCKSSCKGVGSSGCVSTVSLSSSRCRLSLISRMLSVRILSLIHI